MSLVPVTLPTCWGVDTSIRLTEEQYIKLWTTDLRTYSAAARHASPNAAVFPDFIGRYGPLYGNGVGQDLTSGELVVATQTAQAAGRKGGVFMFQHVRAGEKDAAGTDIGWIPSDDLGLKDAQTIIGYADSIGYSVTYANNSAGGLVPHIGQDLENVRAGHSSLGMAQAWNAFLANALRVQPAVYNGFNPGMTPEQFASLGCPVCKDAGPRTPPPGRGFVYEQHEWIDIPGIGQFDVAQAQPDATGVCLVVIGWQPDPATVPTEPAPAS